MSKPAVTYSGATLFEIGMSHVAIARFKNDGRVEIGVFLVDVFCLGVKNAFFLQGDEETLKEVRGKMTDSCGPLEEHSGAWGRKLVEGAVHYAMRLGFAPHRDYKKAARVLGGIDPQDCPETFTFGQGGKPHYIAGPNESEFGRDLIIHLLTKKLGRGGFNFSYPLGDMDGFFDEDGDEDEDEQR